MYPHAEMIREVSLKIVYALVAWGRGGKTCRLPCYAEILIFVDDHPRIKTRIALRKLIEWGHRRIIFKPAGRMKLRI
jgi:hypothetical protein